MPSFMLIAMAACNRCSPRRLAEVLRQWAERTAPVMAQRLATRKQRLGRVLQYRFSENGIGSDNGQPARLKSPRNSHLAEGAKRCHKPKRKHR